MELNKKIDAFSKLGAILTKLSNSGIGKSNAEAKLIQCCKDALAYNGWFNESNTLLAIGNIGKMLDLDSLKNWIDPYRNHIEKNRNSSKNVGVIMAGNIPLVGFHDMLCVLVSGNTFKGKVSSKDKHLLPAVADLLVETEPGFKEKIEFVEDQLDTIDAIIATGSNNTSRYMKYYFGKYPHIIRKNRNSVAVINGNETQTELEELGNDIFTFFGLGCRNVSKLYLPMGYDLNQFFESVIGFSSIMENKKYVNNYEYHRSIYLMDQVPFLENNLIILKEDSSLSSPVATLHYEFYRSTEQLQERLKQDSGLIQCIVSNQDTMIRGSIPFGTTQQPAVHEYADGVDTMNFLNSLD